MTLMFGSRALALTPEQRKKMADEMRWVRSLRKYVGMPGSLQTMEQRKANEREYLTTLLEVAAKPPAPTPTPMTTCDDPIERTERDYYESRIAERECHTRRALAQMASYRHRGPR